ncbi:MAG TPA: menaquinone biosynthesis protein [Pirellulaceae bacterium]|nr:menaquinone biosynthesis protein [Pirellulaceae bacterium]
MKRVLGAVSYFNTVALVYEIERQLPEYRIEFDLPSRLCRRLSTRELDVALIPVVDALSHPDWAIVSDACIACRGPVWSVKLLSRVPFPRIQTLALDEGSRTSIALARLILTEQFGVVPSCTKLAIDDDYFATRTDAVLVIGDRAMHDNTSTFPHIMDLGEAWRDWTGLPFVFAVWTAHHQIERAELATVLSSARDRGVANASRIANERAAEYGLTVDQAKRYLTEHLHFVLGPAEREGLSLFMQKVAEHGLLPAASSVAAGDMVIAR